MQKRRANKISILIVPEDNAEPYSFRLKTWVVKSLYVLGALLILHIIVGAIFYWKYASLLANNKQTIFENMQLREYTERTKALEREFEALENAYKKVRSLLGVNPELIPEPNHSIENRDSNIIYDSIVPAMSPRPNKGNDLTTIKQRYLVTPKRSTVLDYAENVPTLLPVKGFLTMDFQDEGRLVPKSHSGVDIVAKKGTLIRAAGAGVIIFADWSSDLGNLIIIEHGGDLLSYYGHTQRILVSEKQQVKKGQPIALLGSSGKSSGPHLHFEIWKNGTPVDPKQFILAFNNPETTN
ncbi:MAG: M23 family metallopeptidase [bacterium]